MKVLIACEESGIVREAFAKLGHNAWSCDLLDTAIPGKHLIDNVLRIFDEDYIIKDVPKRWDLMIAFPPCTHLALSLDGGILCILASLPFTIFVGFNKGRLFNHKQVALVSPCPNI